MSVRFIPVRGTEAKLALMPYQDGAIYFATDTNKIYLDSGNKRISMGGSGASLYYVNQATVPQNEATGFFILEKDYLINEFDNPREGDLLINTDGCFYKVSDLISLY